MKKLFAILIILLLSSALWGQEQEPQLDPELPFVLIFPQGFGDYEARVCFTLEQFCILLLGNNELIMEQVKLQMALAKGTRDLLKAIMDYLTQAQLNDLWESMKPIVDSYWGID